MWEKAINIVPVTMLREHVADPSLTIRTTLARTSGTTSTTSVSRPSSLSPTIAAIANTATTPTLNGPNIDDDDLFDAVPTEDLSSADIELMRAANISADLAQCGTSPIRHRSLNDPPKLGTIKDVYLSVLGDC